MHNYKWEKQDFSAIDNTVKEFNNTRDQVAIDNLNMRIDLDYISNSDEIEGINPQQLLQNILKNTNLRVLRSYPYMIANNKNMKPGAVGNKVVNIAGMSDEEKEKVYENYLKNTELVVIDTEANQEFHVKTTGHLRAVSETIQQAKYARMIKNTTGENTELTADFIADNINCHILGEPFGRYRSQWYCPVARITGSNLCLTGGAHVDEEMEQLLNWYNNESKDLHPIERAAILHIEFIRIHPFADGNGRTGRLLVNYELVKNAYPTITIKASQRSEYIDAINEAINNGDATKMIDLVHRRMQSRLNLYNSILAESDLSNSK